MPRSPSPYAEPAKTLSPEISAKTLRCVVFLSPIDDFDIGAERVDYTQRQSQLSRLLPLPLFPLPR